MTIHDDNLEKARTLYQDSLSKISTEFDELGEIVKGEFPTKRVARADLTDRKYRQQNGLCGICELHMDSDSPLEMDHKVPKDLGGDNSEANFQLAHQSCNRKKGNTLQPKDIPFALSYYRENIIGIRSKNPLNDK